VNGEVKDGKPISARFGNMAQCSWKALRMDRNTSSIGWTEPVGQAVVKGVLIFGDLETRGRTEFCLTSDVGFDEVRRRSRFRTNKRKTT